MDRFLVSVLAVFVLTIAMTFHLESRKLDILEAQCRLESE